MAKSRRFNKSYFSTKQKKKMTTQGDKNMTLDRMQEYSEPGRRAVSGVAANNEPTKARTQAGHYKAEPLSET